MIEVQEVPASRPVIVASGPLTSDRLAADLAARFAAFLEPRSATPQTAAPRTAPPPTSQLLYFYDAISPIVAADSINRDVAYPAARYGVGGADYLNCPLTRDEYHQFREALLSGERYPLHEFEQPNYFEGCLPIEELAERGEDTLRFGPMRPVGLRDPRTGKRPFAVVQLRQENRGPGGRPTMYDLVGFQTRLRRGDQTKALRLIPGLERAEILRYGSVHRNTFLTAPVLLREHTSANTYDQEDEVYHINLTGSGDAYVFRDGVGLQARWNRTNEDQPLLLTVVDNSPIYMRPGITFYEVIGTHSFMDRQNGEWYFHHDTP